MLQLPENCPEPFEAFTGDIETDVLTQLVAVRRRCRLDEAWSVAGSARQFRDRIEARHPRKGRKHSQLQAV